MLDRLLAPFIKPSLPGMICLGLMLCTLSGCQDKKKPLSGERLSVLMTDQDITVDPETSQKPLPSLRVQHNQCWAQPGGVASHDMPPISLSDQLKPLWSRSIGHGRLLCGPVLAQGQLFLLNANGQVVALHAETGKVNWTTSLIPQGFKDASFEGGGVCYENNSLYVTTGWGEVLRLDPKTGQTIWHHMLGTPIRSAPTAYQERLFVVTAHNELWTFHTHSGDVLWSHAGIPETAFLEGGASPAVRSDMIVVAYNSGEAFALQPENGDTLWSDTLTSASSLDALSNMTHIRAHPVLHENVVLLISHGGRTRAIDARQGHTLWELAVGGIQTPAVFHTYAALITSDAHCICVDVHTGKVRWMTPLTVQNHHDASLTWTGPLWTNAGLLCLSSEGQMVWIDPAQGKLRDGPKHKSGFVVPPIIADDTLYTLDERGLVTAWK